MLVRITISGIGLTVPKIGVGINVFSGCYLEIKANKNLPSKIFGVKDYLSVGEGSGSIIIGHAKTSWMTVTDLKSLELLTTQNLNGSSVEVEIRGTAFGHANGDIGLKIFDRTGDSITVLDKYNVPMDAMQLASTKVRGIASLLHVTATA